MEAASHAHSHDPVPSRWPIITAVGAGLIPVGLVTYVHGWKEGLPLLLVGLAITIFGAGSWWTELLRDRFFGREAISFLEASPTYKEIAPPPMLTHAAHQ